MADVQSSWRPPRPLDVRREFGVIVVFVTHDIDETIVMFALEHNRIKWRCVDHIRREATHAFA